MATITIFAAGSYRDSYTVRKSNINEPPVIEKVNERGQDIGNLTGPVKDICKKVLYENLTNPDIRGIFVPTKTPAE